MNYNFCMKVSQVSLRHALVHKWYGKALKVVLKQLEDKQTKELDKKLMEVRMLAHQVPLTTNKKIQRKLFGVNRCLLYSCAKKSARCK